MNRRNTSNTKKDYIIIGISFVIALWMITVIKQVGAVSIFGMLMAFVIIIAEHGALLSLYYQEKFKRIWLAYGALGLNVVLAGLSIIYCTAVNDSRGQNVPAVLSEKQVINAGMLEGQPQQDIPFLNVSGTSSGVALSWNAVEGAEGYCVYRKSEGKYESLVALMDGNITSYTDNTAMSATKYSYAVNAIKNGKSGTACEQVILTGVWKPTLSVEANDTDVKLTWGKVAGVKEYRIYRKITGEQYAEIASVKDENITEYVDKNVPYGVEYYYAIRAYIGQEKSGLRSKQIRLDLEIPLTDATCEGEGVKVTWNAIAGADGYVIYRKQAGGKYVKIGNVGSDVLEWFDGEADSLTEYYYAARAMKGDYQSKYSSANITTVEFASKKKLSAEDLERVVVKVEQKSSGVELSWNAVPEGEGYHVYRKENGADSYELIATIEDLTVVSTVDDTAKAGKTYLYYVCTYIDGQDGCFTGAKIDVK